MEKSNYLFPPQFLTSLIGKQVIVRLKWGLEYCGTLKNYDLRMNIHLCDAEEFVTVGGQSEGKMGDVLIRCNNILHIRPKPDNYPQNNQISQDTVFENEEN